MKRPQSVHPRRALLAFSLTLLTVACARRPAAAPATAPEVGTICAADCTPAQGRIERRPVLSLTDHGGFGSPYDHTDVPAFVLYADGRVLFVDGKGAEARVLQADLTEAEVGSMLARAASVLDDLPEHIADHVATDQPTAIFVVTHENRTRHTTLEGWDRGSMSAIAAKAPELATLYAELLAFDHDDAVPWQPDELMVSMFNADDREAMAQPWPTAVPKPPPGARQPSDAHHPNGRRSYPLPITYRIDGRLEADATKALAALGDLPLVDHDGHKWIVRTRRIVPGSGTWDQPF